VYISFFTVAISANYTSEFCLLFKATRLEAHVVNRRRWWLSTRQWEVLLPYISSTAAGYLCYIVTNRVIIENAELWRFRKRVVKPYFKIL